MRYAFPFSLFLLACQREPWPGDDDLADLGDSSGDEVASSDGLDSAASDSTDGCGTSTDSTETTDTDSTTETTDTGMEDPWYVTSGGLNVVGQLMSPGPEEFAFPGDMFDGSIPRVAHVMTDTGYAFYVNQHVRFFDTIAHNDLYFTGPDCTGTALDHFASRVPDGIHLNMNGCESPSDLDGYVQAFEFHYPFYQQAKERLDLHWPGAVGFMMHKISASIDKRWYELPIDQPWPIWASANSVRNIFTNECTPIPTMGMCAVAFNVSEYNIGLQDGPFHLEQNP
jgi:hypothetical protein